MWLSSLKNLNNKLNFSSKVTYPGRLYGVKIRKIRAIEYLTLGQPLRENAQKIFPHKENTPTDIKLSLSWLIFGSKLKISDPKSPRGLDLQASIL
jgi:hypothetical protein